MAKSKVAEVENQNERLVQFETARKTFSKNKIEVNAAQVHFDNISNRLALEVRDSIQPDEYFMPGLGKPTESWVNLVIGKHIKETDEYIVAEKRLMLAKENYINSEGELQIATERLGVANHQVRLLSSQLITSSPK